MRLDLLDGALYAGDPEPAYAWLRETAPAYWDEVNELWAVSRHADVIAIETDPVRFTSSRGFRPKLPPDASMIGKDDPEHGAQRRLLSRTFTPRAVRAREAGLRALVRRLVDGFARRGHCDLVRELAIQLPVIAILELLGFDAEAWPRFAVWAETLNASGGGPRYVHPGVMQAFGEFRAEALALVDARRAAPRDDLVSRMLRAAAGPLPRSDDEIALEALLLLNGGSDTTRHVIAGATLALVQHPEALRLLAADPARIPTAVEEFIRWVTPILNMRRTATRDTPLHGRTLRAGDEVLLCYGAANRDPRVFAAAQRFDPSRDPNPHLAFGFGTHFCLGASLARLELRIAFEEILRRLRNLRLAPGAAPAWVPNAFTHGLASLPLEFTPER
jgi:cytochrome P450 family 142 subfamily A polypeptide 1